MPDLLGIARVIQLQDQLPQGGAIQDLLGQEPFKIYTDKEQLHKIYLKYVGNTRFTCTKGVYKIYLEKRG